MSNLQTHYHFNLDFQNMNQHAGGKCLMHNAERHKNN